MQLLIIALTSIAAIIAGNVLLLVVMLLLNRRAKAQTVPLPEMPDAAEEPSAVEVEPSIVGPAIVIEEPVIATKPADELPRPRLLSPTNARAVTPLPVPEPREVTRTAVALDYERRSVSAKAPSGALHRVLADRLEELNAKRATTQPAPRPLPIPVPPPDLEPIPELEPTQLMYREPEFL